jgi:hypothetical protein
MCSSIQDSLHVPMTCRKITSFIGKAPQGADGTWEFSAVRRSYSTLGVWDESDDIDGGADSVGASKVRSWPHAHILAAAGGVNKGGNEKRKDTTSRCFASHSRLSIRGDASCKTSRPTRDGSVGFRRPRPSLATSCSDGDLPGPSLATSCSDGDLPGPGGWSVGLTGIGGRYIPVGDKRIIFLAETLSKLRFFGIS